MRQIFERVTVAGVGLIGGSLALAARAAGLVGEVIGHGRGVANLQLAQQRGIIDRYSLDAADAARGADLLVLAVPVRAMAAVAHAGSAAMAPAAIVTDVGSVKAPIVTAVEGVIPPRIAFVGAHPIAGTEDSGAAAARPDLFRGRRCILTPGPRASAAAVARIRALWEGVGMQVTAMAPERHDRVLAWVSHLPHAIAFSAVNALLGAEVSLAEFSGPSFGDLTRVAASATDTWVDVFLTNAAPVEAVIGEFIAALEELRQTVVRGDEARLRRLLAQAQAARRQWTVPRGGGSA